MSKIKFFIIVFSVFISSSVYAQKKMVALGDSLTEGYGVARESAFPALLEKKLQTSGRKWTVVNSGISGSTTASAISRLKWQIKSKPDLILVALGANDGLRGISIKDSKKNLKEAIEFIQKEKIKMVLCEMMLPPNYGEQYRKEFQTMFGELAKQYKVPLIPFILKGVAGDNSLNLADGIHPNEKGHEIVAENIFQSIKDVL